MTLLTDEIRSFIGREAVYEAPEPIGAAAFRYFALAVGDDNPLYTDSAYAREHGYDDVVAPPTLVCETNQHVAGRAPDADGYIGHRWELPVEGCSEIRGGNAYEFARPVYPSDRITARWVLKDIVERESSDGAPMLIVTSEATYTNQDGDLLAVNRETLIYRKTA